MGLHVMAIAIPRRTASDKKEIVCIWNLFRKNKVSQELFNQVSDEIMLRVAKRQVSN